MRITYPTRLTDSTSGTGTLYVNAACAALVDKSPTEVIGKTNRELGVPDPVAQVWEDRIRTVFETGERLDVEDAFPSVDGTRFFETRCVPEFSPDGRVETVLTISRDITDRKRAEEDYRALFHAVLDGYAVHQIICDDNGRPIDYRFLAVNPAFERMTGLSAAAVLGRRVLDVIPGLEPEWIEKYGRVALTGEPITFESYAAELKKHYAVTAFRPAPLQFACTIADITERKKSEHEKARLEGQLYQAQKMESVGRLAGGVAHDFNNMLSVILGHTELALGQLDAAQPLHADLLEIRSAATRSADLTRQLLAFARKQTIAPKVLDLNEAVGAMLSMLRRLIGEDIDLMWRPGQPSWRVKMDPSQIDQILANLCVNARDAINGVGQVSIETGTTTVDDTYRSTHADAAPGDYVRLAVSDDGCGMDSLTQAHLFEPFFTTKPSGEGTGLGLATVYGIVKQNHGFINVYSEPGKGTTFTIYLPRYVEETDRAVVGRTVAPANRGSETIMVVEDDPSVLKISTRILVGLGYTVVPARSPAEALRIAEERGADIQLLITDVVMPEMNGRQLATRLIAVYPHLKHLYTSGYTANVIAHHGLLDEDVNFLQKPFSVDALATKVREVLNGR